MNFFHKLVQPPPAGSRPTPISTRPMYNEDNIRHPKFNTGVCIGCGACEFVCPVKETPKAIYVKANKIHAVAEPPFFLKGPAPGTEVKPKTDEQFPF